MHELGSAESLKSPMTMSVADFLRAYQMRTSNIMWLLGAGASRAAGIKTAGDMIWDFKQTLYRSQKKLPPHAISDLGDPEVRRKLQAYFHELGGYPDSGASDEYARFFEATYPSAKDRQAYLDKLVRLGKPSYGHLALALLMREGCCRMVWTTNFDRTLEDAAARLYGTTNELVVADLGEPKKISDALDANRFPIYAKLHGDYHSVQLKNTDAELRRQDTEMRRAFLQACRTNGLAVVGYSGRDESVITTLHEALDKGRGFPNGLFWFKRSGEEPFGAVISLISEARRLGVDAHLIDNETFDELMSDVVRFLPETSRKLSELEGVRPPRLGSAKLKERSTKTPAIRTNALPIISHPVMCKLVDCEIGGWMEIAKAIESAGVEIEAQRTKEGVLAFGRDPDIRAAFDAYGIKRFETRSISDESLTYESGELRLIREALFRALNHRPEVEIARRGRRIMALPNTAMVKPGDFQEGSVRPVDTISGTIGNTGIRWIECCDLRLDYKLGRLWLLMEPRIHREVPEVATPEQVEQSREFVRARLSGRFNPKANAMLSGWARLLLGKEKTVTLRSFAISDGIDATFEMSSVTGFSGVLN